MTAADIVLIIILCIWIIAVYNNYSPKIDIVISKNKHTVLLWYNKGYYSGECRRTYIKLFEI